ncbi:MAG: hypothetical protein ABL876_00205 [Chitinophagaceae bacterium]
MVAGDLITEAYQIEYNGLLVGANTNYDMRLINNMTGHDTRSDTVDRFGAHGGVAGRHYAKFKNFSIEGNFVTSTATDAQTKRQALGLAFKPIVASDDGLPLCLLLPGPGSLIVKMVVRPTKFECDITRDMAVGYPSWKVFLEAVDPTLYNRISTSQGFTMPSDTRVITNNGNAPAKWTARLTGICSNPILTNNNTGQVISFYNLTIGANDILTFDSGTSTVKLNGTPSSGSLQTGFSWWDMEPGNNSISISASSVSGGSFSLTTSDAYWIP